MNSTKKKKPVSKYPAPSTNALTQFVIRYLNSSGFKTWRQNNTGVYDEQKGIYRKNPASIKGICDVLGYRKADGRFVAIEIKIGKDKLSPEQRFFIQDAQKYGCICFVVHTAEEFLQKIEPHLKVDEQPLFSHLEVAVIRKALDYLSEDETISPMEQLTSELLLERITL